jgi:hypothetical protein
MSPAMKHSEPSRFSFSPAPPLISRSPFVSRTPVMPATPIKIVPERYKSQRLKTAMEIETGVDLSSSSLQNSVSFEPSFIRDSSAREYVSGQSVREPVQESIGQSLRRSPRIPKKSKQVEQRQTSPKSTQREGQPPQRTQKVTQKEELNKSPKRTRQQKEPEPTLGRKTPARAAKLVQPGVFEESEPSDEKSQTKSPKRAERKVKRKVEFSPRSTPMREVVARRLTKEMKDMQ